MDEQSENEVLHNCITWDDLAAHMFSKPVNNDLNRLLIQEVKLRDLRWTVVLMRNCSAIFFKPPLKLDKSNATVILITHEPARKETLPRHLHEKLRRNNCLSTLCRLKIRIYRLVREKQQR